MPHKSANDVEDKVSSITAQQIEDELRKFLLPSTVEAFTCRSACAKLEEELGLPEKSMKTRKDEIKKCIKKIVDSFDDTETAGEADETTCDEMNKEEPPVKKQKLTEHAEEAPRDAAKIQAKLMTRGNFEDKAEEVICELGPNTFALEPRVFSANTKGQSNVGWGYYKKVKMPVGDKLVWCTVSMNVIVAGSRDWEDGERSAGD
eukprot:GHVS01051299.1.p1 GENE.GHVS01051299.1~~GHVS01051299.1.p1  ORF type:complete len:204 (+),score=42.15 GHVS01051299.1:75-686(+)